MFLYTNMADLTSHENDLTTVPRQTNWNNRKMIGAIRSYTFSRLSCNRLRSCTSPLIQLSSLQTQQFPWYKKSLSAGAFNFPSHNEWIFLFLSHHCQGAVGAKFPLLPPLKKILENCLKGGQVVISFQLN